MNIRKRPNKTLEFWLDGRCIIRAPKSGHKAFYAAVEQWRRLHSLVVTRIQTLQALAWKRLKDAARFLLPARCAPQPRIVNGELQRRIDAPYQDSSRSRWEAQRVDNERRSADLEPHPVETAFRAALAGEPGEDPYPEMTRLCHERGLKSPYEIWRDAFRDAFERMGGIGGTP